MIKKFTKVTGRASYDVHITDFKSDESFFCNIAFCIQDVVLALKLLHFENILSEDGVNVDELVEIFTNSDYAQTSGRDIDATGKRFNECAELAKTHHYLNSS